MVLPELVQKKKFGIQLFVTMRTGEFNNFFLGERHFGMIIIAFVDGTKMDDSSVVLSLNVKLDGGLFVKKFFLIHERLATERTLYRP